jgi:hypothetical protein
MSNIKVTVMKKLRADQIWGMFVTVQFRNLVSHNKGRMGTEGVLNKETEGNIRTEERDINWRLEKTA